MNTNNANELLSRGVEKIFPNKESVLQKITTQKPLRIYYGIDPTGSKLHIGHAIGLRKLAEFQKLGHKVILLIGNFTAMIGDPTDKSSARVRLSYDEVMENCKNYQKTAEKFLNFNGTNPAEFKFNADWLSELKFSDLIEVASNFTAQYMLDRDMFKKRIAEEKPIYLHEFFYPLMQGYDSIALNVDGEIGGNDQMFNMLAGRDLCKTILNKDKFVLTFKLLTDTNGKKMGKSEGNMITLTDEPNEMFGKIMSWTDEMILIGFELCTDVPMDEIYKMENEIKSGNLNPRDAKLQLAYEVTSIYNGKENAEKAKNYFIDTFSKKQIPTEIPIFKTSGSNIIDILVESKLCSSKTDARRTILQGGVKINEQTILDENYIIQNNDTLQKGKKSFLKIILT